MAEVLGSHTATCRVEVLRAGEVVLTADTIAAGSVTLDQTAASRGRVDVTFVDNGTLGVIPEHAGDPLAPYGNELRVWRGVIYASGTSEMVSLGIFRIDDVSIQDAGDSLTIQVAGLDRSASLIDARFETPIEVVDGTNYAQAISDVLDLEATPFEGNFATTSLTAPHLIAEEGSDRWAFAQQMAASIGMSLYFDGDGVLQLQPVTQLSDNPVWALSEGEDGLLLSGSRRWTRQGAFNRVIATGENAGAGAPVRGVATDDAPTSPTYYGGPFGRVPRFYASSLITTDDQAADAAAGILARELGTTQTVDFGAVVNPALEPDDLVTIRRPRLGIDEQHIIDAITIPLSATETMTGRTRATTVVGVSA